MDALLWNRLKLMLLRLKTDEVAKIWRMKVCFALIEILFIYMFKRKLKSNKLGSLYHSETFWSVLHL